MDLKEEFDQLDLRKCLIFSGALLVLYWLFAYNDGSIIDRQMVEVRDQIAKVQITLEQVQKALEDQKKFEQEIKDITLNMKDFERYFSADMDTNAVQNQVYRLAEASNIVVNDLKPVDRENEFPKYNEIAVQFKVEGSFHQIMEFISGLTKIEQAIDFNQMRFKVKGRGEPPSVELETTFVVYTAKEALGVNNGDG